MTEGAACYLCLSALSLQRFGFQHFQSRLGCLLRLSQLLPDHTHLLMRSLRLANIPSAVMPRSLVI